MISKLIYGVFDNAMRLLLTHESLIVSIVSSVNSILAYLVLYCFVWRYWCISYEIKWTKYIINNQWKVIINPEHHENINNETSKQINWYLTHKNTFGNHKWVKYRLFIVAILSALMYIVGTTYHTHNGKSIYSNLEIHDNIYLTQIYSSWPYTLPLILILIIYCKTPSILDNFYIQKEMKYITVLLVVDYAAFYISRTIAAILYKEMDQVILSIMLSISFHIILGTQFGAVLISTGWVNHKVTKIVNREQYKTHKEVRIPSPLSRQISAASVISMTTDTSTYSQMTANLIEIQPKTPRIYQNDKLVSKDLSELLVHPIAFESFMNHLCHEFSMENLLSLVEFLQFQKYVAEEIGYYNKIGHEQLLCDVLVLSGEVPLSAIVYNDGMNLKDKAYNIYKKYIANGAMYSINIAHIKRQKLINLMDNYDIWICNDELKDKELMNLFDEVCKEMKRLMNDSYQRFKTTPEYHQLVNELLFLQ